jgi:hypothetical protein
MARIELTEIEKSSLKELLERGHRHGLTFEETLREIEGVLGVDIDGLDNAVMEGVDLDQLLEMAEEQGKCRS